MIVLARVSLVALFVVVALPCLAASSPPSIDGSLRSIDAQLDQLRPVLRGYPPQISTPEQKADVEQRWHATEAALLVLKSSHPGEPRVLLRLGELYRFGHNLDVPGAGERCVATLKELISLEPSNVDAHLALGFFYTDAGPQWWAEGERYLRRAIELAAPSPLPRAWRALVLACYYQGKYAEAVAAADRYLALEPGDSELRKVRQLALDAAARGATRLEPAGRVRLEIEPPPSER